MLSYITNTVAGIGIIIVLAINSMNPLSLSSRANIIDTLIPIPR